MASKKHPRLSPARPYEKRIIRALRQLTQTLNAHSRQLLHAHDITMPQVICLDELQEKGAVTVSMLAEAIYLSPSTVVGIIDRLEKKKFVTRIRDKKDRRSVFVKITAKGRDFMMHAPHLLHNRMSGNLNTLENRKKVQVADSLDLLLGLMKNRE